jgi:glycosyltransferase involved in cell wall biosynthesis
MSGANKDGSKPKISIVCPSYNHERFVGKFIESVLSQTRTDWELIIADDNSSDNNVGEIEKYTDSRIRLVRHSWNMGINAGLNDGIGLAKGEYIVFCASDDMLYPEHLETVSKILDERPQVGAVACLLTAVDEKGDLSDYLKNWTKPPTEDRYWALRQMFLYYNVFLSPGMTVRTSLLKALLPLSMSEVMLQDRALWVKILQKANVRLTKKPLVYYRRMSEGANISSADATNNLRCEWETFQFLDIFLQMPDDLVRHVFTEDINSLGLDVRKDMLPYVLGRIALKSPVVAHRRWGYETIANFARTPAVFRQLHDLYGFDYKALLSLIGPVHPRKGLEKFFYKIFRHFEKRNLKKANDII